MRKQHIRKMTCQNRKFVRTPFQAVPVDVRWAVLNDCASAMQHLVVRFNARQCGLVLARLKALCLDVAFKPCYLTMLRYCDCANQLRGHQATKSGDHVTDVAWLTQANELNG